MTPSLFETILHPESSKNHTKNSRFLRPIRRSTHRITPVAECEAIFAFFRLDEAGFRGMRDRHENTITISDTVVVSGVVAYRLLQVSRDLNRRLVMLAVSAPIEPASETTKRNFKGSCQNADKSDASPSSCSSSRDCRGEPHRSSRDRSRTRQDRSGCGAVRTFREVGGGD